jgi:two-component system sensor histidine kinase RegB
MPRLVLTARARAAPPIDSASSIGLAWLVRLRWAFAIAELLVGATAQLLGLPLVPLVVAAAASVTVATNALLARAVRRGGASATSSLLAPALVLDGILLTVALRASGGASNPFSVLYIVHVALAALLLDRRATLLVAGATCLGFGALFFGHASHASHARHASHEGFEAHLRGMLAAYALTAIFVGYFVHRIARELERREREMTELRDWAARTERLASLSTLAAGAAHELGTPLATIAVAAKELERAAAALKAEHILADARLVREEADRCRQIIAKMGTNGGEVQGGAPKRADVHDVVGRVRAALGETRGAALVVMALPERAFVVAPEDALVQSLVTLAANGFDALEGRAGTVSLGAEAAEDRVLFRVVDEGPGLTPEIARRLGEPFVSTKDGRGMGLGIFLARTFAERVGGDLAVESTPGSGCTFVLQVPGGVA